MKIFSTLLLVSAAINSFASTPINPSKDNDKQWATVGRTPDEQHHSPLDQINVQNVSDLKLTAFFDIGTRFGQEATPIVVDGVMYFATDWSVVKAVDARTGQLLWSFDPQSLMRWLRLAVVR